MGLFILIEAPEGCKTWKHECIQVTNRRGIVQKLKNLLNDLSPLDTCEGAPKDEANVLGRMHFLQDSHIYRPVHQNRNR